MGDITKEARIDGGTNLIVRNPIACMASKE